MLILICIIAVILTAAAVSYSPGKKAIKESKEKKALEAAKEGMSWPSKTIYDEYRHLPEDSKPYGDIAPMLRALDIKYGPLNNIRTHFTDSYETRPSWNHRCHRGCTMPEYRQIFDSIKEIKTARAEHEQALQLAHVSGDLGAIDTLLEHLKAERELLQSVTKELK